MTVFLVTASIVIVCAVFYLGVCCGQIQQLTIQYRDGKRWAEQLEIEIARLKTSLEKYDK